VDPRRFALLGFGGAAGPHVAEGARGLGVKQILLPTTPPVLSAGGMLTSDLGYEVSHTHFESGARTGADAILAIFAGLQREATSRLRAWFDGEIAVQRAAEMRYGEQIFEIDVPLDGVNWDSPSLVRDIEDRFHRRHEELYTYASPGQDVVFVNA